MKAKKLFICAMAFAAVIMTGCSDDEDGERISVISIELNKDKVFLKPDQTETLTATITPEEATNKNVSWNSSKPEVATVDDNGKVIALTDGETQITVTTSDGNKTAICAVTVTSNWTSVTGVELDEKITSLPLNETKTLIATITPEDATDKTVEWSSSKPEVATVDKDGKVTAIALGQTTITVTTNDEGKTATCVVSVGAPANILDVITDPAFLAYAKYRMTHEHSYTPAWDENEDGILSPEEAAKVSSILFTLSNYEGSDIKVASLAGIEYFPKLRVLDCEDQALTEVDLSKNPNLGDVRLNNNKITKLNNSNNPELYLLQCSNNLLTEINVSDHPKLVTLHFRNNQVSEINVSNNPLLRVLYFNSNKVSVLDISQNSKLEQIACYENRLSALDATTISTLNWTLLCGNQTSDGVTPQDLYLKLTAKEKELWLTGQYPYGENVNNKGVILVD